jgi:hypothetical protein
MEEQFAKVGAVNHPNMLVCRAFLVLLAGSSKVGINEFPGLLVVN